VTKVSHTLEARRARRSAKTAGDQRTSMFQPLTLVDLVGTCAADVGRDTHVCIKAPPSGTAYAFGPEQAREVAAMLVAFAEWVEGERVKEPEPVVEEFDITKEPA
jgi:hypothetical protein